jgi:hypothetical protein
MSESIQNEVGRELKANELTERTVVVLGREDRAVVYTAWVSRLGTDYVAFYTGVGNTTFIAYLREDGELADDTGKRILVYEYLGEV